MRMPTISRSRALVYAALALAGLVLGGRVLLGRSAPSGSDGRPVATLVADSGAAETAAVSAASSQEAAAPPLLVHVVGAVRRPGLYRLSQGSRIDDAIRKAGGPTRKARLALVNLAAPVADGQQVVVPGAGVVAGAAAAASAEGAAAGGGAIVPVHLNTATLEQLDALPGVGPVTAQNILAYRAEHGPFHSVDELDAVTGIGPARLEQLRKAVVP